MVGSCRAGRQGVAVDERDELNGVLLAVDCDGACRPAVDRAARMGDGHPGVCRQRVLHREHLHLDRARGVGRVADLEHERAALPVDAEVAVALTVEWRRVALDAEDRAGDVGRKGARHIGRTCFEDVVAHAAPRYRGLRHRPAGGQAAENQCAPTAVSVSNCSSSVEPLRASVELVPPVIACSTSSK